MRGEIRGSHACGPTVPGCRPAARGSSGLPFPDFVCAPSALRRLRTAKGFARRAPASKQSAWLRENRHANPLDVRPCRSDVTIGRNGSDPRCWRAAARTGHRPAELRQARTESEARRRSRSSAERPAVLLVSGLSERRQHLSTQRIYRLCRHWRDRGADDHPARVQFLQVQSGQKADRRDRQVHPRGQEGRSQGIRRLRPMGALRCPTAAAVCSRRRRVIIQPSHPRSRAAWRARRDRACARSTR
jgi:hypothetical protein